MCVGSEITCWDKSLSSCALDCTSRAPKIVRCLNEALTASKGGIVTNGNWSKSLTPSDLSYKMVWSKGVFTISGSLNSSILEKRALENSL
jgi:hypothetical protein